MRKVFRACIGLFLGVLMLNATAMASPASKLVPTISTIAGYNHLSDYAPSEMVASTVTPIYNLSSFPGTPISSTLYDAIFVETLSNTTINPQSPWTAGAPGTYTLTSGLTSGGIGLNDATGSLSMIISYGGTYTITTSQSGALPYSVLIQKITITNVGTVSATCFGGSTGSLTATVNFFGPSSYLEAELQHAGGTVTSTVGANGEVSFSGVVSAGAYTLTVRHVGLAGSDAVSTGVVGGPDAPLSLTILSTTPSCFGLSNGSVLYSIGGGYTGTTYTITYEGPTNASFTLTSTGGWSSGASYRAGTYTLTLTDQIGGCSTSTNFVIPSGPELTLTPTTNNITCNGAGDGKIFATFAGGGITTTGASTYTLTLEGSAISTTTITSTAGTYTFTGLAVGTYTLSVTDGNCATKTTSVSITEPTQLGLTLTSTTSTFGGFNINCYGGTGTINASATGGVSLTGTYTYTLEGVETVGGLTLTTTNNTGIFSSLKAGNYTVTVTDANGCTTSSTTSLTQPTAVTLTGTVTSSYNGFNVSCNGARDGAINATAGGGVSSSYTFTLVSDAISNQNTVGTGANVTFSNLAAGTYTLSVTDANGCTTTTLNFVLTEPEALVITPTGSNFNGFGVSCEGATDGTITITTNDAFGTVSASNSYIYSITGGTTPTSLSATTVSPTYSFTGLGSGTYTVTVTPVNGCTPTTSTITLTAPTALAVTLTASDYNGFGVGCISGTNGTISVTTNNGYGTTSYTYTLEGTLTNTTITTTASSYEFTGLAAGSYTVTVTPVNGCSSTVNTITLSEPTPVVLTASAISATCNGSSTGSISATATGGVTSTYYTFYLDKPGVLTPTTLTATIGNSVNFPGLAAGTYTLTVADANGCSPSTITLTVLQPDALSVTYTTSSYGSGLEVSCYGLNNGTITATAISGTSGYVYQLSGQLYNGQAFGTITNAGGVFTSLYAGTYTLSVTDANSCTTTEQTIVLDQPDAITLSITTSNYNGFEISCLSATDGQIIVTPSGGTSGTYVYTLTREFTASTYTVVTTSNNVTYSGLVAGTYTISVRDVNNCTTTSTTIVLEAPEQLTLAYTASSFNGYNISCNGGSNATISATATGGVSSTHLFSLQTATGTLTSTNGVFGVGGTGTLTVGAYTLTVSDANSCTSSPTLISINLTEPPALTISSVTTSQSTAGAYNINCYGGTGTITVTAAGGATTTTYTYSLTGQTTVGGNTVTQTNSTGLFDGLLAGNYTITVADINGCETLTSTTLTQPTALTLSYTLSNFNGFNVSCNGSTNGTITATTLSSGTSYYTYTLAKVGVITPTTVTSTTDYAFTGLGAGTYTLSVTDANSCTVSSVSITLIEMETLTVTTSLSNYNGYNISCNAGSNGTVTATASGGVSSTSSYIYTLAGPVSGTVSGTVGVFNNLTQGNYTLSVTDANGCSTTTTIFTVTEPPVLTLSNTVSSFNGGYQIGCFNGTNGSITATAGGGVTGTNYFYTYTLVGTSYTSATRTSTTSYAFTGLGAGTYTLSVTDANACAQTNTTITLVAPPALSISATIPVLQAPNYTIACNGNEPGTISLSVSGGVAPYTYSWIGAGGFSATTASITTYIAGDYTVTVTDANGCVSSTTYTLTDPTVVVTNQPANQTVCAGSSATFTVTVAGLQPTGTSDLSYQWQSSTDGVNWTNISGATSSSYTLTGTTTSMSGNRYRVQIIGFCNEVYSSPATLNVNTTTAITSQPVSISSCTGQGSNATFSVTAVGTNLTYQWYSSTNNGVTYTPITGATNPDYTAAPLFAGLTYYRVEVIGACGTVSSTEAMQIVDQPVNITTQPMSATLCAGTSTTLQVTATGSTLNYQWYKINGSGTGVIAAGTSTSSSYTTSDAGSYYVIVSNNCGQAISSEAVVTVNPLPQGSLTGGIICAGSSASLTYTSSVAGAGPYTVVYSNGTTNTTVNNVVSGVSFPVTATSTTGFTLVSVTDASGCVRSSGFTAGTATVTVLPLPTATLSGSQTICANTSATLSVSLTGTAPFVVTLNDGTQATITGTTGTIAVNPNAATTYTIVSVRDANCSNNSGSGSAVISINTPVTINTQPTNATVCSGSVATLSVSATGTAVSYQWYNAAGAISGATASTYTTTTAGTYYVIARNTCGQEISSNAVVTVNTATLITSQPSSIWACQNSSVSLPVTAVGTNLTYQWYVSTQNGSPGSYTAITDGVNPVLTVTGISAGITYYYVVVSGSCGTATSTAFFIEGKRPSTITAQPASQSVCSGSVATLSVTATGDGYGYQWYRNGVSITGATAATYTTTTAGSYHVVVLNQCANVASSEAVVTVNTNTAITSQPAATTVCSGSSASFSVTAVGTNLTYQWYNSAGAITGATSSSYSINTAFANDNYYVVVSGSCGTVTSTVVGLSIWPNLTITAQPASVAVCSGSVATLSVSISGVRYSNAYQWYNASGAIVGATGATYTTTTAGSYYVVVTGPCNNVTSSTAVVTVNAITSITSQPAAATVCAGSSATLSVSAVGTNLTYQWYNGATAISGATSSVYTINNTTAANAGNYSVVVSGTCGTVTSSTVTLTVNQPVAITAQPVSVAVCSGSVATLSVSATGTAVSYQWYNAAGTAITGATAATYTTTTAGSYYVVVSNSCGQEISSSVVVTVNALTAITSQPAAATVCAGSSATLSVSAVGTNLTYQWYNGATAISGATSSVYTINNTATANAGNYSVVVSGTCGTVTSSTVTLTVNQPVAITAQPVSVAVCSGSVATLSVSATGTAVSYQWYNAAGTAITGATAATYTTTTAGSYYVVVRNSCGQEISATAVVTVNTLTAITTQPASATACVGSSVSFSVSAVGTNLTYQWFNGTTAISGATSAILTINNVAATNAGNYTVVVTGACGTVTSSVATLTVPVPTVSVSANPGTVLCQGQNVVLTATGGVSYIWYRNGTQITGITGATLTVTTPGEYSVRSVSATGCQSVGVAIITITQLDKPKADFSYDTYCNRFPISFINKSIVTNSGPVTFQWTDNQGNTSTLTNPVFTYNTDVVTMKLKVIPTLCPMNADSISKVITLANATPGLRLPTVDALKGSPVRLAARDFGTSYLWTPGSTLDDSTIVRPTATLNAQQEYRIRVTTAAGCQTVDTLLVRVFNNYGVYVPNVFSPNGDGNNDRLFINLVGVKNIKYFRVFDRYGKVVFETSDAGQGWDGTYKGEKMPLASYVWVVEAVTITGIPITERGVVTLLR